MNYWIKLFYIGRYGREVGHVANVKSFSELDEIMSRYPIGRHQITRIEVNEKEMTFQALKSLLGG